MTVIRRFRRWTGSPGLGIAGLSFGVLLLWLGLNPPLAAPDEPSHLQTIMQVRNGHRLPEVHFAPVAGRWQATGPPNDPAVDAYSSAHGYGAAYLLIPYEASQPPLYYLATGLVAGLLPGDPETMLYVGRVVAALFGAGAVYFCWAAARQAAPSAPSWAVAAAGVVALLPQFGFNSATAGNDSAVNCLGGAAFYVWFRGLRDPRYDPRMLWAGTVVGLALLAKLTALALLPGLGLVVLFRAGQGLRPGAGGAARLRRALRLAAGASGALLAVAGWWFVRNRFVYGEFTGSRDVFAYYHATFRHFDPGSVAARTEFLRSTWESLWGRFRWMDIRLPAELYVATGYVATAALGLSVLAVLVCGGRLLIRRRVSPAAAQAGLIMAAVSGTLIASYLQFSLTVAFQPQGRYLFLLLVPGGLLFTGGLATLFPAGIPRTLALAVPLLWLALLNVVGLAILSGPGYAPHSP